MPRPEPDPRPALGLLAFALGVVVSYTLQRLLDARTEPPIGTVVQTATIPYYWRVGTAVLHGLGLGTLAGLGLREAQAAHLLALAPWLVPLLVLPAALALTLVP